MPRPSTRPKLVQAALDVVRRDGASHLTLDAVAAEAGVSKGGLLYHFPDKESLLVGLLDEALDRFDEHLRRATTGPGGASALAYLEACAEPDAGLPDVAPALAAVLASDPSHLGQVQERFAVWQQAVTVRSPDPVAATVVRLAADGLWFADAFGLAPLDGAMRAGVLARLRGLVTRRDTAGGDASHGGLAR